MGSDRRKEVAVLGGGVGGMTAAFELTKPEHEGRFDVTVYQLGWRLGGKGASGVNTAKGNRIEEHGLHIWFGFYANAFRMMGDVYAELARPAGSPLATVAEAFAPCPEIALYDEVAKGVWKSTSHRFRRRGERDPWDLEPEPLPSIFEVAVRLCRMALDALAGPPRALAPDPALAGLRDAEQIAGEAERQPRRALLGGAEGRLGRIADRVAETRDDLRANWGGDLTGPNANPRKRAIWCAIDAGIAAARGMIVDGVLREGWRAIDDRDWVEWLRCHGASDLTIGDTPANRSPVLRSVYDVAFSFPGGRIADASAAAGTASSDLLKLVACYRGELAYKMTAGMGDAVFAPIYDLLDRRGVKFEFFHAVTALEPSKNGKWLESIDVVPQLGQRVAGYDPLVTMADGLRCWPSAPLTGRDLVPDHARLETELDPLGGSRNPTRLVRGKDFDEVVLAIPVGALPDITPKLRDANWRFDEMVEHGATVRTQAFQLWTNRKAQDLGHPFPSDSVAACFEEPLDTYCDMEQARRRESWGPEDGGLAYVCGVLDDRPESQSQANARVKRHAIDFVENRIHHLWPGVARGAAWAELFDPQSGAGSARFDAQYWRANIAPWERYVITPADNVRHRLPADASGFDNLVLAGDWTDNGLNGGCVEAAVISGKQAARKLTGGNRKTDPIIGEDPAWPLP